VRMCGCARLGQSVMCCTSRCLLLTITVECFSRCCCSSSRTRDDHSSKLCMFHSASHAPTLGTSHPILLQYDL
jgi:hypothetical protein